MLIERIWSKQPGKWFCLATIKNMGAGETPKEYWFKRHQLKTKLSDKLEEFNAKKLNVFFVPHGFKEPKRKKSYAVPGHILYADDVPAPEHLDVVPTWIVQSSPGKHYGFWLCDEVVDEPTNQAWTYHIGADKGGWDFGQLLRVPGSKNRKTKYGPKFPTVKFVGGSDRSYSRDKFKVKSVVERANGHDHGNSTYLKWEAKLKASTRKALLASSTGGQDRSKVLWRLNKELIEAGVPSASAFKILRATVWNKFKDRRDGDERLKGELKKSVGQKLNSHVLQLPELFQKTMAEVEAESFDWLWYPYMARGELTIVEGDPGVGKSWLVQKVCGQLASGKAHKLPSPTKKFHRPLRVMFFDHENSAGHVMKPRLVANGCTMLENIRQEDAVLSMLDEEHVTAIMERLEELQPDVIVFDTLSSYLGNTDPNNSVSVANALASFKRIARQFNCSVVVIRHMNKGKEKALYRGQGNITFTGTARCCVSVGWSDNDKDERLFAVNKINVARMPPPRAYSLTDIGNDMAKLEWGEERPELNADDIINLPRPKDAVGETADDWLKEQLESGLKYRDEIMTVGGNHGYLEKAIMAAARRLNVDSRQKGFGKKKRVIWTLPG